MTPKTVLELGRVSNLPTVISNVACGAVLGGGALLPGALAVTALSGALFYVGGMVLNDAFDADIDARERPERPIPSGRATPGAVFRLGFALLFAGLALLVGAAVVGIAAGGALLPLAGLATAALVVLYDRFHKGVALSPFLMGLCRAGLYAMGALATSNEPAHTVWYGAGALLLYVVGLTHVARFETSSSVGKLWITAVLFVPLAFAAWLAQVPLLVPAALLFGAWTLRAIALSRRGGRNIGRAVVSLIAGISLVDALLAVSANALAVAVLALASFALTLGLQRWVSGT